MAKKFLGVLFILILIAGAVVGILYHKKAQNIKPQQGQFGGSPVVFIQTPQIRDVENYELFTGNTRPVETVDIRARVEGFLQSVNFSDGAEVKAGEQLFTIEPDSFQAALQRVMAQLESNKAERERSSLDYERIEKAAKSDAVSKQDLTTAKTARDKARAAVTAAEAALKTAELDLSYTRICSPIDGIINFHQVSPGNLVGAGQQQTLLATVVTIQPIYVTFNVSEKILQEYFIEDQPGRSGRSKGDRPTFSVGFSEDDGYPYEGYLDYLDNSVDPATGNILVRGVLANEDRKLLPGLFVRVRVPTGLRKNAVLIEERALQSDIGGRYVLILDAKDVVHTQYVKLSQKIGEMRVIESGLKSIDRYIVTGFNLARPGSPVTPQMEGAEQAEGKEEK